jgi:hypothetical protein
MNDTTIGLARVDEDIFGYEFSDEATKASAGGRGVEVVFARGINEDFIFPTRPAAASSETPQPNLSLQVTAPEVATAGTPTAHPITELCGGSQSGTCSKPCTKPARLSRFGTVFHSCRLDELESW